VGTVKIGGLQTIGGTGITGAMTLYCPWCGDTLSRDRDNNLGCVQCNMWLSKKLEHDLREAFESKQRASKTSPLDGMIWYCAGCGEKLVNGDDGVARCPTCQHTMGEFSYSIIEFHPHNRPSILDERLPRIP
jgi:uncharacterized Zn finger protein (UPF0148 family)